MQETIFDVDTGKGFNLSAALYLKPNVPDEGIVIMCHGLLNNRFSKTLLGIIEGISYHALSVDFQGNGLSGGTTSYGNNEEEVENIRCIVSYVRKKLNRKVLCICGHSKGAADVLLYASKYNDVPLIVSLSARYDHTQIPPNRFTPEQFEELQRKGSFVWVKYDNREYVIRQEDIKQITSLDMSVVKNIDKQKIRVLTVHGSKDKVIPVEDAYIFDKLLGPEPYHKLVIVQDAGHLYYDNMNHQKIMVEAINSWLDENKSWSLNESSDI
ncbi:Alpha/Beta hydrolase protein [Glomus cerebriforme]|uniref:Alpha/Beta hydrolase protein n=1 Tax=Glomus cerebriforme TaxID=658196 RepID=A0A397TKA3_9GLOM|nr:Alpha/Beta hydrolase protein [Glomus cerebriforme]